MINGNDMKIRKATENDLKVIDKIYLEGVVDELRTQYPKRSKSSIIREINKYKKQRIVDFKKDIKDKKQYWIVAEVGGDIVGFGSADTKYDQGRLVLLYIKKEFRRKGIGKKLTKERMKWLKKKGAKKVYSGMLLNNLASRRNLEKIGFKPVSIKLEKFLK